MTEQPSADGGISKRTGAKQPTPGADAALALGVFSTLLGAFVGVPGWMLYQHLLAH